MDLLIIALILPMIVLPIVAFALIKSDGRYHCHVPGCNESFESLYDFIEHLKSEHEYTAIMIGEILGEITTRR